MEEVELDTYSNNELVKFKRSIEERTTFFDQENNLFDSYLTRYNPNVLRSANANYEASSNGSAQQLTPYTGGQARRKKDSKRDDGSNKPMLLLAEQKCEIATRELDELREEAGKQKDDWGKILDNLKAEMEEVDMRVTEVRKAMFEFKRDIAVQAVNHRTGKVIAERVLRYYEEKTRAKDTIIEKVRLKNATLKVQNNKLHLQLKQKEEMGEVLHIIDFDQLQIENKQYQSKIEERNTELLLLKKSAGNTSQVLNLHKKKLLTSINENEKLAHEIKSRKDLLARLTAEATLVRNELNIARSSNTVLKEQLDECRVPHVMDYIQVKAKEHELTGQLKSWERRVEIAAMKTNKTKRLWVALAAKEKK